MFTFQNFQLSLLQLSSVVWLNEQKWRVLYKVLDVYDQIIDHNIKKVKLSNTAEESCSSDKSNFQKVNMLYWDYKLNHSN